MIMMDRCFYYREV